MDMNHAKHAIDAVAAANTVATLTAWLPPIAAFFTIVWTLIRIYETDTIQRWIHGRPEESE
jgi:uncharacterized protein YaaW (UPF0174 family)